jgi:hypothetical protein
VYVWANPTAFAGERVSPDGSPFVLGPDQWAENPRYALTAEDWLLLEVWQAWRPSSMGVPGILPEGGGYLNQTRRTMQALRFMSRVEHEECRPRG